MNRIAFGLILLGGALRAQTPDDGTISPFRLEFGSDEAYFQNAGGWWHDVDETLWIRKSPRFIPALTFDTRTSDTGTQRYYSFFSYANWTPRFYTTQAVSGTADSPGTPLLFPRFRYDVKAWYKLGASRQVIPAVGVTRYTINGQGGYIVNPALLYYRGPYVFDVEAFVNRNEPGTLWSGSGLVTVQRGRERHYWVGASAGAGRQTYQELGVTPLNVRYASVSVNTFYRKWLTRNFGIAISAGYMDAFSYYQRFNFSTHLFFDF